MRRTISIIAMLAFFLLSIAADLHAEAIGDALHGQFPALDAGENQ